MAEVRELGAERLRDADALLDLLRRALETSGHQVLGDVRHRFSEGGEGFSGVFLLAESHASLHSYPELDYLALDLFSCGARDPRVAFEHYLEASGGRAENLRVLNLSGTVGDGEREIPFDEVGEWLLNAIPGVTIITN